VKAWSAMCGSGGNSKTFIIPSNKTFLLQPLTFQGPCKSPSVQVKVIIDIFINLFTILCANYLINKGVYVFIYAV